MYKIVSNLYTLQGYDTYSYIFKKIQYCSHCQLIDYSQECLIRMIERCKTTVYCQQKNCFAVSQWHKRLEEKIRSLNSQEYHNIIICYISYKSAQIAHY